MERICNTLHALIGVLSNSEQQISGFQHLNGYSYLSFLLVMLAQINGILINYLWCLSAFPTGIIMNTCTGAQSNLDIGQQFSIS